jgi:hypothetical protein
VVDLGLGFGSNYGIVGVKTVLGKKGTGLMIGVGTLNGFTSIAIGGQVTYNWWFATLSYGPTGSYRLEFNNIVEEGLTESFVFITGGRINLSSNKRLFLELGIGIAAPDKISGRALEPWEANGGFTANAGLGYRIGIQN